MATKVTKASLVKIHRQIAEVLQKMHLYSDVGFIYADNMVCVGGSRLDLKASTDEELVYTEPKITVVPNRKIENYNGNPKTMVLTYDGGPLYSVMSGEFGWDTRERFMEALESILGPYHLAVEEINSWSLTFYEGGVPEHEKIMDKLATC